MASGFSVPDGFCVTVEAYTEHIALCKITAPQSKSRDGQTYGSIYRDILRLEFDPILVEDVIEAYHRLTDRVPAPVAVRSSATLEDLAGHSFAGLYATVLYVKSEAELLDAIKRCWASYWSEEAVLYREQAGLENAEHGMAVLIQTMLQPKLAGVLFTQAPAYYGSNAMVVELVRGNAESLVNGEIGGERLVVDKKTRRVLEASHAETLAGPSVLDPLLSLGLAVERHQGSPQDIEWCLDDRDCVWVVQARPVTHRLDEEDKTPVNLTRDWHIAYDEPFSPLGCDLAIRRYGYWVRAINRYYRTRFKPEMISLHGFLYYKSPWTESRSKPVTLWMILWRLCRWLAANRTHKQYACAVLPGYVRQLEALDGQRTSDFDMQRLLANFNSSVEVYLDLQFASYPVGALAVASARMLDRVCRLCFGAEIRLRANDFLAGLDNLTVERDVEFYRLAQAMKEISTPEGGSSADSLDVIALTEKNGNGPKLPSELQHFLATYGYIFADRYPRDPAWRLNGERFVASLARAADTCKTENLVQMHTRQKQRRLQAIQTASAHLLAQGKLQLGWRVFHWCLRRAELFFPHKENRNHYVYQSVMVIQKYAREIGRRLEEQGLLQFQDDVFFLTWEEIQKAAGAPTAATHLGRQVEQRKRVYQKSRLATGTTNRDRALDESNLSEGAEPRVVELIGESCSPGVAVGLARVVRGPSELQQIKTGDIMICRRFRPAWSSALIHIAGIVIEELGLLSHGATLAREYGIPAVINIAGVNGLVPDGSKVVVDGNRGVVLVLMQGGKFTGNVRPASSYE